MLGQRELAIATIRSSVEIQGSVRDVPEAVPCVDLWIRGLVFGVGRGHQHARWQ